MTAVRLTAALAAAFALLALGAWAGGAFSPVRAAATRPGPRFGPGLPPSAIDIGDALEVSGQPMQLSVFTTSDPPSTVARFHAEAFQARGVLPIVAAVSPVAHVSGFDPVDGLQRFISAVPQPDGRTLVLLGVTDPRHPPRFLGGAEGVSFPVPPAHRALLVYRSRDGGARAETAQFVSPLSPAGILDFYRAELAARGFRERTADSSAGLALFAGPGSVLSVAVQELASERGAAVFVTRTSGGAG